MRIIPAALAIVSLIAAPVANACTAFELTAKDGGTVYARTMEFGFDVKSDIVVVPAGTEIQTPAATSVTRDYASFTSKYSGSPNMIVAWRHINFAKREIPADRAADYIAFLHAVQSDAAQRIMLMPSSKTENGK